MNKYQKIKMIGEGSFGKAFLVKDKNSNKQYVIKEINMSRMGAKEREEARKEVAVLAQLQHPNIVSYKESFEEVGNLYISMDYCEAGDLYARINAQRGVYMREEQILDMFVQICLSIKHIHDRKILHRDIKSQNIFITKGGIMKLGDFGIAKVMNSTVELARTCIGTPYYLSPEICENRPYNNKSDIWSLGCVLYEMTTLKHPFESGNMKNLVLKIIRGTYPSVPPRFGYELRNLISQMFKRSPRERPSINAILKKPFIQERIRKFLSESEVQDEFSHTILHGQRLQKRLPPGGRPISAAAAAPAAKRPTPSPAAARYDPSSIYRNRVAPRARPASAAAGVNRPPSANRQNSGGAGGRPPSAGAAAAQRNNDIVARRRELAEKEKNRRADAAAKRADDAKQQHQKLVEKQKQDRINKGKEQWRHNLLDSYGENKDADKKSPRGGEVPSKPAWVDPVVPAVAREEPGSAVAAPRGNYGRYHDALQRRMKEREENKQKQLQIGGGDVGGAPSSDRRAAEPGGGVALSAAQRAAQAAQIDRQKGAVSAERARVIEEYRERQRQAMLNKARGQADIRGGGVAAAVEPQSRPPSAPRPRAGAGGAGHVPEGRHEEESEYLQRLRQIRLQNFNERRALQDKKAGRPPRDMRYNSADRQKKIEALKAQADERAKQLKAQLEKKRQEALVREQRAWQHQRPSSRPSSAREERSYEPSRAVAARPESAQPSRAAPQAGGRAVPQGGGRAVQQAGGRAAPMKAVPMPGLTNVLNAIGVDEAVSAGGGMRPPSVKAPSMTNVMSDIGAGSSPAAEQQQPETKPAVSDRPRWGAPAATPIVQAAESSIQQQRSKWDEQKVDLSNMKLESTGSQMEATSAQPADSPVRKPVRAGWGKPTVLPATDDQHRPAWGSPSGTVMNALQAAQIDSSTVTISPQQAKEAVRLANQSIGETISIAKPVIMKKPFILPKQSLTGATITISKDKPDGKEEPVSASAVKQSVDDSSSPVTDSTTATGSKTIKISDSTKPGEQKDTDKPLADTSVPLFDKVPQPSTPENKMAADSELDVLDLELNDNEKKVIRSLERAKQPFMEKTSGLMIGLTIGHFDCNKTMLRTCSEPDLAKLFRTSNNPFMDIAASATFAGDSDSEGEPDTSLQELNIGGPGDDVVDSAEPSDDMSDGLNMELDDVDDDMDEEDEDASLVEDELRSLMASHNSASTEDSESKYQRDLDSMTPTAIGDSDSDEDLVDSAAAAAEGHSEVTSEEEEEQRQDAEDFEIMRQTLQQIVQDDKSTSKADKKRTLHTTLNQATLSEAISSVQAHMSNISLSNAGDKSTTTTADNKEEWVSDESEDSDHGSLFEDEDDMFCRLEESRANLEQELGEKTFMKAYKIVQAIHEDEDETIEDGSKLVTKVLGAEKSYLYDKILHLVVADSAYIDDN